MCLFTTFFISYLFPILFFIFYGFFSVNSSSSFTSLPSSSSFSSSSLLFIHPQCILNTSIGGYFVRTILRTSGWIFSRLSCAHHHHRHHHYQVNGSFKKKCQLSWSFVFCWSLLSFYLKKEHTLLSKIWFSISQMAVLLKRINFILFSMT